MTNKDPDIRETHDLIASDMVVGTNVYDIQDFDWDAESGRRVYDYYGIRPYWI
ncbi:hypothetical protein [Mesorhizobium sp.]|uniref:hypothetical protein n=1 Tax=Mesorhizobium sp. TaxID=1871066 RepID=UPI00257D408B|nr:hypothetical protein [Mesorhizobium sp.]